VVSERSQPADPIAPVAARCTEGWLEVRPGVELRVLQWQPDGTAGAAPLVFVAGWVSVLEGWRPVLRELVTRRPVIYVETREKHTASIAGSRLKVPEFTIARLAGDLISIAASLGVDHRAVWFGSSMGSNAILEALKGDRLPGRGAFLVGPNARFLVPWWGWPLLRVPGWTYRLLKGFVIWYIRRFRVDASSEPEQMERYERTLAAADPVRLKLSARAVLGYTVWPGLDTVSKPVAIAFAPTDTLHSEDEVREIVAAMPNAWAVDCPSNAYMHDARIVEDIEGFIDRVER